MISEIQTIINNFAGVGSSAGIAGGAGAPFEMWLLLKIAERLHKHPFDAELRDAVGIKLKSGMTFSLRGGPGKIGVGSAGYVHFLWKSIPHEIHANVQFRGRSTETHEVDIAVVPATVAAHLRTHGGGSPTGQPRVAVECKFKPAPGSKDEARQVVARQFDMHFLDYHPYPYRGAKSMIWPENVTAAGFGVSGQNYMQSFSRCFNALCRIGGVSIPTGIYLTFNSVNTYDNLKPGTAQTAAFLDELELFLDNNTP